MITATRHYREVELSDPVSRWLRRQGFTVYTEVPLWETSVDIVGERADILVAVELKMTLSKKVRYSAWRNQDFAHCSFAAVPTRPTEKSLSECRQKGIGVLRVLYGAVHVIIPAAHGFRHLERQGEHMRDKLKILSPGGRGGMPFLAGEGPAQAILSEVEAYRGIHRDATWAQIYEAVPNHYSNPKSMAQSLNAARARQS